MALYQEAYELSNNFPSFDEINKLLKERTGLNSTLEIIGECSAVFSNELLKTEVEAIITLFFP